MTIRTLRWAGWFGAAVLVAFGLMLALGAPLPVLGAPGAQDTPPAPRVFDTDPLPGEELGFSEPVTFYFTLPMDPGSVDVTVDPALALDLAWGDDNTTLTVTPGDETYARATTYTFTIGAEAASADGVPLEEPFTLALDTVGYLEVSEVLPAPDSEAVDTDSIVTVIFDRPVVPLVTVEEMDTLPDPLQFDPPVEGQGEWLNTSIYVFTPEGELRGGTTYTATVEAGLEDVTGAYLPEDFAWTFRTIQPDVVSITPGAGMERVPLEQTVSVEFSQAMDPQPTEDAITLWYGGLFPLPEGAERIEPQPVSGTFEWSDDFRQVTFTPDELLELESMYRLEVDAETARSATGAQLRESAQSLFDTVPYPRIEDTSPADGTTDASPYGGFSIHFNTNMDIDTLEDKVIIEPEPWREFDTYYYDYNNSYNLAFDTEPSTEYTITILPGMADEYGNTIDEGMTVSYITAPYPPELTIQATGSVGMYSAANPSTRVFVTHRNISRIDLSLWRMSTARLAALTAADSYDAWRSFTPRPADLLRQWTIDVSAQQDTRRYELLYISDSGPSGIANIECLGAPDPRVKVGDVVLVTRQDERPLNVRQEPNLGDNVVTQVLPGDAMQITGGPFCSDGYLWWRVRLDNDISGWVAEGDQSMYYIEPLGAVPDDPNAPESDAIGQPYTPDALDPGAYFLAVTSPETEQYDGNRREHVLLVQSVNLSLKFSQDSALAWVTHMESGAPVAGVPVIFYNADYNPVARAVTDADGLAVVEIPHLSDLYTTMYALVNQDDLFGFASSQWSNGMDPWQFEMRGDYEPEDFTIYLYTDRPIYRPGQPVYFKGIMRQQKDVAYFLPERREVPVKVYDDRGEEIYSAMLPVTPQGSFSGELMLDEDAPLGYYRIVVDTGSNRRSQFGLSFNVAEYRAPEFQVNLTPERDEVAQGDTIRVLVDSTYFFGGPVSNADVSYSVLSNAYRFNYTGDEPGYWSFTDENYDFYAPEYYGPTGGPVAEGEGTTDDQGRFMIELVADLGDEAESRNWTVEARVVDESDQLVAGRTTITVHQGLLYVGLQPQEYIGYAGRESLVNLLAVDWDSQPIARQDVDYEVVERRWFSVQEEDEFGRTVWTWDVQEEPVADASGTVTTGADGLAQIAFTPPVGGVYKVYATTTDDAGNTITSSVFLWVSGSDFVNWRQENNNRIQLITDQDEYEVGDTAEILIPSPWQGEAYALVTVERGDILAHEVLKLETNSTVYELPIEERFAPNIFVSVMLVKGVDENNPTTQFRMGMTELQVDTARLVMNLDVEPSVDVAAGEFAGPGDEVTYTITATDWEGTPVPGAEIGVGLTDLAVLSIAPPNSPDLLPFFYSNRGVTVRTASALSISVDQATQVIIDTIKGGGGGYGEGGIFEVRQEFVDTPLWEPSAVTDADGQATVSVTLPDNLTTWRLDARAVTTGEDGPMLVGQTTFDLLSTKPVLVRPATPRFFVAGDNATVGMVVNNNTAEDLLTEVTLEGYGFELADGETLSQWVEVPAKGRARVNWSIVVGDVPEVDLTFYANAGDGAYTDASKPTVTQGDPLPVYKYEAPETVGTAGTLYGPEASSRTEVIALPRRFDVTQGELTINLDRSLAAATIDGLDWLENFPHYCIEQIISRFLPNAITLRALESLDIDDPVLQARLEAQVGFALQRLYNQQKVDGGWGWFPQDESNPVVTAYALIGLVEAQRSGFTVDADVINNAADFVRDSLRTVRAQDEPWRINRQAFLLYALARVDRGEFQRTVRLFDERESMSLYAKAYLAMTFHMLDPDDGRAMELVNDLNSALVLSATGAHWEETYHDFWNWNTDTRTTALGLMALAQIDPENQMIPNIVRWLMVARDADHWETTQETAWSVMALTEWMVVTGELYPDYTFRVELNGERLMLEDDTATPDNVKETATLVVEVAELLADEANRLAISRSAGDGNLYYTAHLTAYLPVPEIEALNRGIVIDRKYSLQDDPDATPITSAEVGQPVQVTLTIIAPNDLHYVVVEDPIPAGADAINPNLETTSQVGTRPTLSRERPLSQGWGWWWFSNTEFRDEKVVLYATYLPRGTYQFEYVIYPGLAGEYNVIPPTAQEFYFPEVYGRGEGSTFTITGGSASETVPPPPEAAPLTQAFTLPASGVTVQYPEGWVAQEGTDGTIEVASSAEALADLGTQADIMPGEAAFVVMRPIALADLGGLTAAEFAAMVAESSTQDDASATASSVESVTVDGREVALFTLSSSDSNTEGFVAAYEDAGHVIVTAALTYAGELAASEPTLHAMIGGVSFDPAPVAAAEEEAAADESSPAPGDDAALTETYTTAFGLSFDHPAGWFAIDDPSQGVVQTANREAAVMSGRFEPGDSGLVIFDPVYMAQLPASTPDELLRTFMQLLEAQDSPITFGAVSELSTRGMTVPYVPLTQSEAEGAALVLERGAAGDDLVLVFLAAYEGEFIDARPLLLDIVASISYDAP